MGIKLEVVEEIFQDSDFCCVLSLVGTKGGIGKSTITANLAALLADLGFKVLMIDGDRQQTLSKHYDLKYEAEQAISYLIKNSTNFDFNLCISNTDVENLDLLFSDIEDSGLEVYLGSRPDGAFKLHNAIKKLRNEYDFIFIDSRGAKGLLLEQAVIASDLVLMPVLIEKPATQEVVNTIKAIEECIEARAIFGLENCKVLGFPQRVELTNDSQKHLAATRKLFKRLVEVKDYFYSLKTEIPGSTTYKAACTAKVPVHRFQRKTRNKTPAAMEVMTSLLNEILFFVGK